MSTATITGPLFAGVTFIPEFDEARLTGQWMRVWDVMSKGDWLTLTEIQAYIHLRHRKRDSEAGISARIRDFRKPRFGGHTVEKRRRGDPKAGLHEYRLII
jgi:hypothetical protein